MPRRRKHFIRFSKREYKHGEVVPVSAIYEFSECDNVDAYKKGEVFTTCDNCHSEEEEQHWYPTTEVLHFVSKNLNTEFSRVETLGLKVSDIIAQFSGSITFVILHVIWFWAWIHANNGGSIFGLKNFDPYPFGLLTMIVSLEAIILSTFILISQNRQAQKSELRADLDYKVNLSTEKAVAEVLAILRDLKEEGQVLSKKASEILEDTTQITEPEKKPRKGRKKKPPSGKKILKDAGIDLINQGR
ncbi:MAG: DUF1003 domain-containing protein [Candidatus Woesearchaeota archaeon]